MTIVGRSKIDHPALGTAGGSALHASIETIYTNIGDDLAGRFDTASSIANSTVTTFDHNFGVDFADLKVLLYTGTHPNLTRVSDPAGSGWTIAATVGFLQTKIDVTTPASGGPHTFAVFVTQGRETDASATASGLVNTSAQTFAGKKTFADGLGISGGAAANSSLWTASNVLRVRGGTSGFAVDNTSGTPIGSSTDAGAWQFGPLSGANSLVYGTLTARPTSTSTSGLTADPSSIITVEKAGAASISILSQTGSTSSLYLSNGNSGSSTYAGIQFSNNTLSFRNGSTADLGIVSSLGAWTFGPSSGDMPHVINGIHTASGTYTGAGNIRSGVYGPSTSNKTNISSDTHYDMNWIRVGNMVIGSGYLIVATTSTGGTVISIDLPVASNFTSGDDCTGAGAHNTAATTPVLVLGDTVNDKIQLTWTSTATSSSILSYSFCYHVK